MRFIRTSFVSLSIFLFGALVAKADSVTVAANGLWGSGAPVSNWSAPGDTWSFSFTLPSPTPATNLGGSNFPETTDITSFSYTLNGSPVSIAPDDIVFFPMSEGGGFEIDFDAAGSDTTKGITCSVAIPCSFDVLGGQFYTGAAPSISVQSGSFGNVDFDYAASVSFVNPAGTGTITSLTVTQGTSNTVPEPATLSMLAFGALGLAMAKRGKRSC